MNFLSHLFQKILTIIMCVLLFYSPLLVEETPEKNEAVCSPLHVDGKYIKNDQDAIIHLHGCQGGGAFNDGGNGNWMTEWGFKFSSVGWNTSYVESQLNNMVEWGANMLRIQLSVELWMYNIDGIRSHMEYMITEASNRGIYCIISPYQVRYWGQDGCEQDPLPYPPYCNNYSAQIIPNTTAFVNWHSQLTDYYKNYSSVIWEVWNEPYAEDGFEEFKNVTQQCITNARNNGANQMFLLTWGNGGLDTSWVDEYTEIDDPADVGFGLLWHCYNAYNHLGYPRPTTFNQVAAAMSGIVSLAENHPCFIGEFGAEYTVSSDTDVVDWQMTVMDNAGIHYVMHWLRPDGPFMYVFSDFSPTTAGQVLIDHMIAYQGNTHYLTINSATGGSTTPLQGVYNYTAGILAEITANASEDYSFDHWILDGLNAATDNPITVPMCLNHTLTPVFTADYSWSTGFESGNFSECTGVLYDGVYSADVVTTNPKTGIYHANFVSTSQYGYSCGYKTFSDRANVTLRFQISFVEGYADTDGSWLSYGALANSGNGESVAIVIKNVGGQLYWGLFVNGEIYLETAASNINSSTYYQVELVRNVNGLQQLYVDDVLKAQQTTVLSYGADIATFGVDFNTGKSVRVYIDDVFLFT
ncbi:MAG: cellulase family glycosylhydrolase [Candidatus Bathyarchaeia archaeon]|jgi:hypothetical protein